VTSVPPSTTATRRMTVTGAPPATPDHAAPPAGRRGLAALGRAWVGARAETRRRAAGGGALRVLYLLETGGPGGAERMLLDLAQHVGPRWQPVIGVMRSGWLQAHATSAGLPCVVLRGDGLGDVGVFRGLLEAVATHKIAVIHAHEFYMGMVGTAVSLATGVPLVVTIHGKHYYPDRWRRRAVCRLVAARAAAVVTVSDDLRRFFCQTTGTPPGRVRVIYNGIDTHGSSGRHGRAELLDAAGIPRSAQIVGTVGNLYPVKGHSDLIRALGTIVQRQPQAHVVILGRGDLHDTLLSEAAALGVRDRVHLLGYRDDVRDWLAAMDVYTMPSLSEGLPLSLLEAMTSGRPAVVTGVGGMPEAVRDGQCGFVVPPRDVSALADRISFLLGDAQAAARMGVAARDVVTERFGLDRMVTQYRDVYDAVAGGPRRPASPRQARAGDDA
jgi:glycosyltransferase involved in cell wall biosynthesis